jgi:NAD+ diphosphatase
LAVPLPLARAVVDRAAGRRTDRDWLGSAWNDPASRVVVVGGGHVATDEKGLAFVAPGKAPEGERYFLGTDDSVTYLAVHVPQAPRQGATLRQVGADLSDRDTGLAVHAIALANWHETHTHCPRCGAPTHVEQGGHVRRCAADDSVHFPRTDPAVIMLVTDENDRCLLGSAKSWPENRYSTLAGFVEPGETPERAVVREVMEESAIGVTECWYAGAQPWPFPSSLMLGYYATARGDEPIPDGDEIRDVRWFTRADVTDAIESGQIRIAGNVSIARRLLEGWLHRG